MQTNYDVDGTTTTATPFSIYLLDTHTEIMHTYILASEVSGLNPKTKSRHQIRTPVCFRGINRGDHLTKPNIGCWQITCFCSDWQFLTELSSLTPHADIHHPDRQTRTHVLRYHLGNSTATHIVVVFYSLK